MPGPGLVVAASMTQKTWFITGTSRGFGREWTEAALDRGDRVAATARDISTLDDLVEKYGEAILPLQLDVTDRAADFAAVEAAHRTFGQLDVVVNNAGYGRFGSPRRRCPSCGRRGRATSSRSRRSVGSPRSRASGPTTRPSGRSRASAR